jgi:hypothetical protein
MNKPVLSLFRVFGAGRVYDEVAGRYTPVVLGTFGKRHQAIAAMTAHNKKLAKGERPAWVGPGPDHWRSKENVNNDIPVRGNGYRWAHGAEEPRLEVIQPDEWLDWYTSRKEVAYG